MIDQPREYPRHGYARGAGEMAASRGTCQRFLRLTRHNHISLAAHFNSGEEILGLEILDFIERGG